MGGDNRGDSAQPTTPDAATQHILDQLNAKFAQDATQQTTAQYGGVAPLAANPGAPIPGRDAYYHGGTGGQTRAGYGVSGTLAPGGAGDAPNKPNPVVPNFIQAHQDQIRNPNQPYTPNPIGQQAAQGMGAPGRPGAAGGDPNEARVMADIKKRGQYLSPWTAGFGGLGSLTAPLTAKALSFGADGLVERTKPGTFFNNAGKYWQNNYDITKVGKADMVKAAPKVVEADSKFATLVQEAKEKVTSTVADPVANAVAKERLSILDNPVTANSAVEMAARNKALVDAGKAPLFSDAEVGIVGDKYAAGLSRAAEEKAIIESLQKSTPSMWKSIKAGMGGVLVDMGAVQADRWLGNKIGGENSVLHSWNTEQILAPSALALGEDLVGKSLAGKALLLAGTVGVSRLIDGGSQAVGLGAPEKWNAVTGVMNGWDGFGIATGLAIAAAAKNPWAKLAAVGAGWAIPKVVHLFEDSSSNALAYRYEDLTKKITDDHSSRSYSSLEAVTKASESLEDKKEDWLVSKIETNRNTLQAQWGNMSPDQKLLAFRDDAGLSAGLGEELLQKGSRIATQGDPKYTLGGYEMDLGGRAMHYLVSGKDSVQRAEQLTNAIIANNSDSSKQKILVNGSEPKQSEVNDLQKYEANIKADLDKIYNQKHDVQGVVNQVIKDEPMSSDDWRRTYILPTDSLIEHYAPRNLPDQAPETRKVIAKLYRDQAIAYLAFAQSMMDHKTNDGQGALDMLLNQGPGHDIFPSGRPKAYTGAEGAMKMSALFDPNNPDLAQINQIWQKEVAEARAAANTQMTHDNILNVGGMQPHPAGQDNPQP